MGLKILNRRARRQELVEADKRPELIGSVMLWAGPAATIPAGWLQCDGGYHDSFTYPDLAAKLGTTWGPLAIGGPSPQFPVPDFRGRLVLGNGSHPDVAGIANTEGQALGTRRPNHTHAAGASVHNHTANHGHAAASHNHSPAGNHRHTSNSHTHTTGNHDHGTTGITGNPNVGASADANQSETDTRNMVHNHSAGSLFGDANSFGPTGASQNQANGGFTDFHVASGGSGSTTPAAHGSNGTEATDFNTTANAQAVDMPFLALHWIIKAVA